MTGVDLSRGMIDLAAGQESRQRLGIEYVVGDARELRPDEPFDVAVAAYLLNYSRTADELQAMCDGVARSLKPGGRFVTVNCSPALDFPSAPSFRQYGFETIAAAPWGAGTPITWRFHLDDGPFEIENYHLDVETHEQALRRAGFRQVRWHAPRLSPDGLKNHPREFWSDFLNHPPVTLLECRK